MTISTKTGLHATPCPWVIRGPAGGWLLDDDDDPAAYGPKDAARRFVTREAAEAECHAGETAEEA